MEVPLEEKDPKDLAWIVQENEYVQRILLHQGTEVKEREECFSASGQYWQKNKWVSASHEYI